MTTDTMEVVGRITVRSYDSESAAKAFDEQDVVSDKDRLETLENECEPVYEESVYNVTCVGMHEYFVDNLDINQSTNDDASHLAIGDDAASGTASSDTSLNNEVERKSITDSTDNGNELATSTFFSSSEANGFDIDEVGLFTESSGGLLLNHATFSAITKDSSNTLTLDVDLTFQAQ